MDSVSPTHFRCLLYAQIEKQLYEHEFLHHSPISKKPNVKSGVDREKGCVSGGVNFSVNGEQTAV